MHRTIDLLFSSVPASFAAPSFSSFAFFGSGEGRCTSNADIRSYKHLHEYLQHTHLFVNTHPYIHPPSIHPSTHSTINPFSHRSTPHPTTHPSTDSQPASKQAPFLPFSLSAFLLPFFTFLYIPPSLPFYPFYFAQTIYILLERSKLYSRCLSFFSFLIPSHFLFSVFISGIYPLFCFCFPVILVGFPWLSVVVRPKRSYACVFCIYRRGLLFFYFFIFWVLDSFGCVNMKESVFLYQYQYQYRYLEGKVRLEGRMYIYQIQWNRKYTSHR